MKNKITMRQFIRENREMLDEHISAVVGNHSHRNDDERESWVLNDESLYLMALEEGVKV